MNIDEIEEKRRAALTRIIQIDGEMLKLLGEAVVDLRARVAVLEAK